MKPKYGSLAYCAKGNLGIITSQKSNSKGVWKGINITKPGLNWSSKCPKVVGFVGSEKAIDHLQDILVKASVYCNEYISINPKDW